LSGKELWKSKTGHGFFSFAPKRGQHAQAKFVIFQEVGQIIDKILKISLKAIELFY